MSKDNPDIYQKTLNIIIKAQEKLLQGDLDVDYVAGMLEQNVEVLENSVGDELSVQFNENLSTLTREKTFEFLEALEQINPVKASGFAKRLTSGLMLGHRTRAMQWMAPVRAGAIDFAASKVGNKETTEISDYMTYWHITMSGIAAQVLSPYIKDDSDRPSNGMPMGISQEAPKLDVQNMSGDELRVAAFRLVQKINFPLGMYGDFSSTKKIKDIRYLEGSLKRSKYDGLLQVLPLLAKHDPKAAFDIATTALQKVNIFYLDNQYPLARYRLSGELEEEEVLKYSGGTERAIAKWLHEESSKYVASEREKINVKIRETGTISEAIKAEQRDINLQAVEWNGAATLLPWTEFDWRPIYMAGLQLNSDIKSLTMRELDRDKTLKDEEINILLEAGFRAVVPLYKTFGHLEARRGRTEEPGDCFNFDVGQRILNHVKEQIEGEKFKTSQFEALLDAVAYARTTDGLSFLGMDGVKLRDFERSMAFLFLRQKPEEALCYMLRSTFELTDISHQKQRRYGPVAEDRQELASRFVNDGGQQSCDARRPIVEQEIKEYYRKNGGHCSDKTSEFVAIMFARRPQTGAILSFIKS